MFLNRNIYATVTLSLLATSAFGSPESDIAMEQIRKQHPNLRTMVRSGKIHKLVDKDGEVGVIDLLSVIGQWGTDGSADVNGDGVVDVGDLLAIVDSWGQCP